tara:strand:- start:296 stop:706 length:411 start_codon:yes stop_codon:yes gene_type:complete
MGLKQPESMDECVYFTRRVIGSGKIMAWVFRGHCPECKEGIMGKPVDAKTGKAKIRAKEYVCKACSHQVEKSEYEDTLTCNIAYTCPHCSKEGETQAPFKWKTFQGVKCVSFNCGSCNEKIGMSKKMANPKKKKKK